MINALYFSLPSSMEEVLDRVSRALDLERNQPRYSDEYEGGTYWLLAAAGIEMRLSLNQGESQNPGFEDCLYALMVSGLPLGVKEAVPGLPGFQEMNEWVGLYFAAPLSERLEMPVMYQSYLGPGRYERIVVSPRPNSPSMLEGPGVIRKTLFFSLSGSSDEVADRVGQALCLKWNRSIHGSDLGDQEWSFTGAGLKIHLRTSAGTEHRPEFGDCTYAVTLENAYANVSERRQGLPDQSQVSERVGVCYAAELAQKLGVPVHFESRLGIGNERVTVTPNPDWPNVAFKGPKAFLHRVPF